MGWSFGIGRLFGIPIRVHWSMLGLVILFALIAPSGEQAMMSISFMALLFVTVTLHELGHALVARRFGVATKQIVLMPIGGAAVLEGRPTRWSHDLLIAAAGPLTSLVIGGIGVGVGALIEGKNVAFDLGLLNLAIGVFNLVPALPLDGGHMLRAGLERWLPKERATKWAARVGRAVAMAGFVVAVMTGDFVIAFASMFVFTSSTAVEKSILLHDALLTRRVKDTMDDIAEAMPAGGDVTTALELMGRNPRATALPVTFGERVIGVIHRTPLLYAAAQGLKTGISELLDRNVITFEGDGPLQMLVQQMGEANSRAAVIVENHEVRGIITVDRLVEALRMT